MSNSEVAIVLMSSGIVISALAVLIKRVKSITCCGEGGCVLSQSVSPRAQESQNQAVNDLMNQIKDLQNAQLRKNETLTEEV